MANAKTSVADEIQQHPNLCHRTRNRHPLSHVQRQLLLSCFDPLYVPFEVSVSHATSPLLRGACSARKQDTIEKRKKRRSQKQTTRRCLTDYVVVFKQRFTGSFFFDTILWHWKRCMPFCVKPMKREEHMNKDMNSQ